MMGGRHLEHRAPASEEWTVRTQQEPVSAHQGQQAPTCPQATAAELQGPIYTFTFALGMRLQDSDSWAPPSEPGNTELRPRSDLPSG